MYMLTLILLKFRQDEVENIVVTRRISLATGMQVLIPSFPDEVIGKLQSSLQFLHLREVIGETIEDGNASDVYLLMRQSSSIAQTHVLANNR